MDKKNTDVLFVFSPAHGNFGAFQHHLGVAYLRAALAKEGLPTAQYMNESPAAINEVANDILQCKPQIVGFTAYDANFALCLAMTRALKQKSPDIRVIFGGPSASFCAKEIMMHHPAVDACVLGEAEETGPAIFDRLLSNKAMDEAIPGLAIRRNGEILVSPMPPLVGVQNSALPANSILDASPSPYLSGVLDNGRAGVLTGRGCTHHCQYCCFAALGRKRLRLHSIERVLEELEWIAAHQRRTGDHYIVPIHDDAFTLLPERAKSLCQAIADRKLGLMLSCITRADAVDVELLQMMKQAGFASLAFGLESAVPAVLRATGKVRPPDWPNADLSPEREFVKQVRTSVINAKKLGFNVGVSIILGLPAETARDGQATLEFVKKLPVDFYMHNFLWVFPGTPLWDTKEQYGVSCAINSMGLATTIDYAYDLTKLRPRPKCSLEQDLRVVRMMTADALHSCGGVSAESGLSVAVLESGALNPETAEWLTEVLNIGGLLIQKYPPMPRREELTRLYEDRCVFSDYLVPARNHVQMLPRGSHNDSALWRLACSGVDLYSKHKPKLVSLHAANNSGPFLKWLHAEPALFDHCDVANLLHYPKDILQFVKREGGGEIGARLRKMPASPHLKYPGRWLKERVPCLSLHRIEIDSGGFIRPCSHAKPIGKIGDNRQLLAARLKALSKEANRRRGCATCPATHCPRCPFPAMDDRTYCGIMKKQVRAIEFLSWSYLYSRIPSILALHRDKLAAE